jgi:hypothetical protein
MVSVHNKFVEYDVNVSDHFLIRNSNASYIAYRYVHDPSSCQIQQALLAISAIPTKPKAKEKFRTADMFLFYILQKNKYFDRYIFLGSSTIRHLEL